MPQYHAHRRVADLAKHVLAQHEPSAAVAAEDEAARAQFDQSGFLRLPGYFSVGELTQMTEPVETAHSSSNSPVALFLSFSWVLISVALDANSSPLYTSNSTFKDGSIIDGMSEFSDSFDQHCIDDLMDGENSDEGEGMTQIV